MLVVADSSPLVYLSRVGAVHLLPALFDEVVVPRAVWDEAVERRPSAPGISALLQASWLRVVDDPSIDLDLGLDPGETAAIILAESLRADLLLIDERAGRKVAQVRGPPCGVRSVSSSRRASRKCYLRLSLCLTRSWPRAFASRLLSYEKRSRT